MDRSVTTESSRCAYEGCENKVEESVGVTFAAGFGLGDDVHDVFLCGWHTRWIARENGLDGLVVDGAAIRTVATSRRDGPTQSVFGFGWNPSTFIVRPVVVGDRPVVDRATLRGPAVRDGLGVDSIAAGDLSVVELLALASRRIETRAASSRRDIETSSREYWLAVGHVEDAIHRYNRGAYRDQGHLYVDDADGYPVDLDEDGDVTRA